MTRLNPLLLAAALPIAACGGGSTPSEYLTLTASSVRPPASPRAAEQGRVITVTAPTVPQALRYKRIPVYVSNTAIQYLEDAQWVEGPNELFRQLLSETIAARTGLVVIDPSAYTQVQGMVLGGQLLSFGLDPAAMEVVADYEATLARPEQAVASNRFQVRISVSEATPAAVAPALNRAANQLAEQVAVWISG